MGAGVSQNNTGQGFVSVIKWSHIVFIRIHVFLHLLYNGSRCGAIVVSENRPKQIIAQTPPTLAGGVLDHVHCC